MGFVCPIKNFSIYCRYEKPLPSIFVNASSPFFCLHQYDYDHLFFQRDDIWLPPEIWMVQYFQPRTFCWVYVHVNCVVLWYVCVICSDFKTFFRSHFTSFSNDIGSNRSNDIARMVWDSKHATCVFIHRLLLCDSWSNAYFGWSVSLPTIKSQIKRSIRYLEADRDD